jgi:hypothetical protein
MFAFWQTDVFALWQTDVLTLWQTYNAIAQNQAVIEYKLLIFINKNRPKGRMKAVLPYNRCVCSLANRCACLLANICVCALTNL